MRTARCLVSLVACLTLAPAATSAQSQDLQQARQRSLEQEATRARTERVDRRKRALAEEILDSREEAQQGGPLAEGARQYWIDRLARLPIDSLQAIAAAGPEANLRELAADAESLNAADAVAADFGDSDADLVFTRITPCRVADTRVAGGPLASASQRNFYVAGSRDFTSQGGVPCGVPSGATSVALNLTVTGTTGFGWLRTWPTGSAEASGSVINYVAGTTLANGLILPICDPFAGSCVAGDLTVRADAAGTQVVIDVMGYFTKPARLGTLRTFTVTAQTNSTVLLPEASACTNYQQIQVVAPGAGEIVVSAKFQLQVAHLQGDANEVQAGIATAGATTCTGTGFAFGYGTWQLVPAALPSATYYPWDTVTLKFDAPAAGTYRFYLNGKKTDGAAGTAAFQFGGMLATFNPR
jgi:hypothetical protein